ANQRPGKWLPHTANQASLLHQDPGPDPWLGSQSTQQLFRYVSRAAFSRALQQHQMVRQFESVATHTIKLGAEHGITPGLSDHPGAVDERRLVSHMLSVLAA